MNIKKIILMMCMFIMMISAVYGAVTTPSTCYSTTVYDPAQSTCFKTYDGQYGDANNLKISMKNCDTTDCFMVWDFGSGNHKAVNYIDVRISHTNYDQNMTLYYSDDNTTWTAYYFYEGTETENVWMNWTALATNGTPQSHRFWKFFVPTGHGRPYQEWNEVDWINTTIPYACNSVDFIDCDTFTRSDNTSLGNSEGQGTAWQTLFTNSGQIVNNSLYIDTDSVTSMGNKLPFTETTNNVTFAFNVTVAFNQMALRIQTGDKDVHDGACQLHFENDGQITYINVASHLDIGMEHDGKPILGYIIHDPVNESCFYKVTNATHSVNTTVSAIASTPNLDIIRFYYFISDASVSIDDYLHDVYICDGYDVDCYPSGIPPTSIPENVTIHSPLDYSMQTANPLNFIFEFDGFDSSECHLYRDDALVDNLTGALSQNTNYTINDTLPADYSADLTYQIVCIENVSSDLVNSTYIDIYYSNDFSYPVLTFIYPSVLNHTYDTHINYTFSTDEVSYCGVDDSHYYKEYDNSTYFIFKEINLSDTSYNLTIQCNDTSFNNNSISHHFNYTLDTINPEITYLNPDNNTEFIGGQPSFNLVINMTDNRALYNYKINITSIPTNIWETEQSFFYDTANISGLNYLYNGLINLQNFTNSTRYQVKSIVCDSHTDNNIDRAKSITKTDNAIEYILSDDTYIKVESFGACQSINTDTTFEYDRYSFDFEFSCISAVKKFRIFAGDSSINYLSESDYKGHFVVNDKYWLDFEQDYPVSVDYDIEEGYYVVTVHDSNDRLKFNSLGELNCNTEYLYFNIISPPSGFELGAFSLENTTNVLLLGIMIFLYIGLIVIGLYFKNFAFSSFAFFIGLILGFMLSGLHIFMTILFWFMNVLLFIHAGKGR